MSRSQLSLMSIKIKVVKTEHWLTLPLRHGWMSMSCTAAIHTGPVERVWLHFWRAVMLTNVIDSSWVLLKEGTTLSVVGSTKKGWLKRVSNIINNIYNSVFNDKWRI